MGHLCCCLRHKVFATKCATDQCWEFTTLYLSTKPCIRYIYDSANATGGYGEGRTDFSESYYGGADNATLGALADSEWLYVHPDGMRRLLAYVSRRHALYCCLSRGKPDASAHECRALRVKHPTSRTAPLNARSC